MIAAVVAALLTVAALPAVAIVPAVAVPARVFCAGFLVPLPVPPPVVIAAVARCRCRRCRCRCRCPSLSCQPSRPPSPVARRCRPWPPSFFFLPPSRRRRFFGSPRQPSFFLPAVAVAVGVVALETTARTRKKFWGAEGEFSNNVFGLMNCENYS